LEILKYKYLFDTETIIINDLVLLSLLLFKILIIVSSKKIIGEQKYYKKIVSMICQLNTLNG